MLLTTAGMQQFKPYFMGLAEPPAKRLTSVQKCFRTSDIDHVGLTARHCTFFEMLGNFSIGDYFKEGAIQFAWEFSRDYLALDADRIWISYFEGDDDIPADEEAVAFWEAVGVPRERMVGLPRKRQLLGSCGGDGALRTVLRAVLRSRAQNGAAKTPTAGPDATATATWSTGTWCSRATTWTRTSNSRRCPLRTSTRAWGWSG